MIPRLSLAHLPTPVEFLPRLTAALRGPRIWVKRDDQTGIALGGNKVRKLEYLLAEAQANGARTLVTVGGIQSNHCRQTAALAARMGLDCILVLSGEAEEIPTGNELLDTLFGAKIVWTTRSERDQTLQQIFEQAWVDGARPFLIPLGASTPTGTIGYYTAFQEFMGQDIPVDWIVIASSSGGTQAGLILGAAITGWSGKILGISIDHPAWELEEIVASLATQAAGRLGLAGEIAPESVLVNDHYLGDGYAVMGDPELEAIQLFAKTEGLLLDPVYTGKAAAGMVDLVHRGFFSERDRILFWHTGGIPAIFAGSYASALSTG